MRMRLASEMPEETEELFRQIIGAAIDVHRHLGPGFLESVYEQALCHELSLRNISFEAQKEISVPHKQIKVESQRLDILVANKIILELKAVERSAPIHEAQIMSYLKATQLRTGLIINLNVKMLKDGLKRIVL